MSQNPETTFGPDTPNSKENETVQTTTSRPIDLALAHIAEVVGITSADKGAIAQAIANAPDTTIKTLLALPDNLWGLEHEGEDSESRGERVDEHLNSIIQIVQRPSFQHISIANIRDLVLLSIRGECLESRWQHSGLSDDETAQLASANDSIRAIHESITDLLEPLLDGYGLDRSVFYDPKHADAYGYVTYTGEEEVPVGEQMWEIFGPDFNILNELNDYCNLYGEAEAEAERQRIIDCAWQNGNWSRALAYSNREEYIKNYSVGATVCSVDLLEALLDILEDWSMEDPDYFAENLETMLEHRLAEDDMSLRCHAEETISLEANELLEQTWNELIRIAPVVRRVRKMILSIHGIPSDFDPSLE